MKDKFKKLIKRSLIFHHQDIHEELEEIKKQLEEIKQLLGEQNNEHNIAKNNLT